MRSSPVPTQLVVTFDEKVDPTTAQTIGNYAANNSVTLSNPTLDVSGKVVTLTTTTLSNGINYTLTLNGIKDANQLQGTIAANTTVAFALQPPPSSIAIRFAGTSGVALPPASSAGVVPLTTGGTTRSGILGANPRPQWRWSITMATTTIATSRFGLPTTFPRKSPVAPDTDVNANYILMHGYLSQNNNTQTTTTVTIANLPAFLTD